MQVNGPDGQKVAWKKSLPVSAACMATYWPTPGFKGEPSSSVFSTGGIWFLRPQLPTAGGTVTTVPDYLVQSTRQTALTGHAPVGACRLRHPRHENGRRTRRTRLQRKNSLNPYPRYSGTKTIIKTTTKERPTSQWGPPADQALRPSAGTGKDSSIRHGNRSVVVICDRPDETLIQWWNDCREQLCVGTLSLRVNVGQ